MDSDLLGFRISKHVSEKQYHEFQDVYTSLLEHRAKKWTRDILKVTGSSLRPPSRSAATKRLIRKGIPMEHRPLCWFEYSGARTLYDKEPLLYDFLVQLELQERKKALRNSAKASRNSIASSNTDTILGFIDMVDRDMCRTFPDNKHFRTSINSNPDFEAERVTKTLATLEYESQIEKWKYHVSRHYGHNPYLLALRRVLVSFVFYSWPRHSDALAMCSYKIGYCQSLNFIVGMLLLVFTHSTPETKRVFESSTDNDSFGLTIETKVFWMLVAIVERLMPVEMYGCTLEGSLVQQEILWSWIREHASGRLNALSDHFDHLMRSNDSPVRRTFIKSASSSAITNAGISSSNSLSMISTPWFMALFVNAVPTETVLRIWDCFFYQGEKILFRVAMSLLEMHDATLSKLHEPSEIWTAVRDLPKTVIDCEEFIKACFSLNDDSPQRAAEKTDPIRKRDKPSSLLHPTRLTNSVHHDRALSSSDVDSLLKPLAIIATDTNNQFKKITNAGISEQRRKILESLINKQQHSAGM